MCLDAPESGFQRERVWSSFLVLEERVIAWPANSMGSDDRELQEDLGFGMVYSGKNFTVTQE
jgi:hypothetical protein